MRVKFTGDKEIRAALRKIAKQLPEQVEDALYVEAEMVMTRSKRDYVPVDLGPLRASGKVERPSRRGREIGVELSYGGPSAPYALAVHEHPGPYDPPSWKGKGTASATKREPPTPGVVTFHPAGRGPKYLERPMKAAVAGLPERVAKRIGLEDLVK